MNCDVIKDLIPLYIDGCCSDESTKLVKEHIECCDECKKLFEDMSSPSNEVTVFQAPKKLNKINDWKASVLQSVLLFVSFALITIGVAFEAKTEYLSMMNGVWAQNLVVPATGFMLSLANWYFVRLYKSRTAFSYCSVFLTLFITLGAYIWSDFHYSFAVQVGFFYDGYGFLLTAVFCILSKILSDRYAKMIGKE